MNDIYIRLGYDDYKSVERQMRDFDSIETAHTSVDGYYHKAIRLRIGDVTFELQGPLVKEPLVYSGDGEVSRILPNDDYLRHTVSANVMPPAGWPNMEDDGE